MKNDQPKSPGAELGISPEVMQSVEATAETPVTLPTEDGAATIKKHRKNKTKRRWFKHKDVNNGQVSFAAGLNIYKIIWVFVFGCVIGVVMETFLVYAVDGVLARRSGMLYGPFNQVYGFGAVLFTVLLYRYRNRNNFIIFLAGAILGTGFEYLASWVQELLFGSTSWNYDDMSLNIGGRTNLLYGVGWGVMGLLFLTHFWPWMSEMIERIPNTIGRWFTVVVAVALALNLALSAAAVLRQRQRLEGVPATNAVARWLDAAYPDDYMQKKYPSMTFGPEVGGANAAPAPQGTGA